MPEVWRDIRAAVYLVLEMWRYQRSTDSSEVDATRANSAAPDKKEVVEEVEGGMPCVACEKQIVVASKYCPFCGWTQP